MEDSVNEMALGYLNQYNNGEFQDVVQETASGLKYIVHEMGTGEIPNEGYMLMIHYNGFLMDGTPFDNSYRGGTPYKFPLGKRQVIAGWDEAFALFPEGTKVSIIVPYDLAYGAAGRPGSIPEKADLYFFTEFTDFYNY